MKISNSVLTAIVLLFCHCTNPKDQAKEIIQNSETQLKSKTQAILNCYQTVKSLKPLTQDHLPNSLEPFIIYDLYSKEKGNYNAMSFDFGFLETVAKNFKAKNKRNLLSTSLFDSENQFLDAIVDYQNGIIPDDSIILYKDPVSAAKDRLAKLSKLQYVVIARTIKEFYGGMVTGNTYSGGGYQGEAFICRLKDAQYLGGVPFETNSTAPSHMTIRTHKNASHALVKKKLINNLRSGMVTSARNQLRNKLKRFYVFPEKKKGW